MFNIDWNAYGTKRENLSNGSISEERERTFERQYDTKSIENCHRVGRMKDFFHSKSILSDCQQKPLKKFFVTYFPFLQSYTWMKTHIIK